MKKTMSVTGRLGPGAIFCGGLVTLAMLLPLDASAQPFWNVHIGVAGTFQAVGGVMRVSSQTYGAFGLGRRSLLVAPILNRIWR
jgi:hypothetical protein